MENPIYFRKNILFYCLIWTVAMAAHILFLNYFLAVPLLYSITDGFIFNFILALLGLSFWYPVKFTSIEKLSISSLLLRHSFAAITSSALWLASGFILTISVTGSQNEYGIFLKNSLPWRFLLGILFYLIISSFYYIYIYYFEIQQKKLRESELSTLVKEAELKTLKFQINPHFIFNSLNSISSLTIISPEKARDMTIRLSDFLRYTLSANEKQKTRFIDEISNAKRYLEIEEIRFGGKFEFKEEVEASCLETEIPGMLLQPLLENAIKHGVCESLEKVVISLQCFQKDGFLQISVSNNFEPGAAKRPGTGIGLQNIKSRLRLIYGRDGLMQVNRTENNFTVILYIPVENV